MPDDLRILRASEIGEYVFCHRAWWLHRVLGVEQANRPQLDAGIARHADHGRAVRRTDSFKAAARVCLLGALIFAVLLLFAILSSPH
ncbi:MAG TPA: hypothetical protein VF478_00345 [Anaerolineae bacterium]